MKKHLALASVLLAGGIVGAWLRSAERTEERRPPNETVVIAPATALGLEPAPRAEPAVKDPAPAAPDPVVP